jgi:hypothetical protein
MDERKRGVLMAEKPFAKFILIDEPARISSFGVLARVRPKLRDELEKRS